MRFLRVAARRLEVMGELLWFLWRRRLWWLVPIVVVLLLFSVLLILAQSPVLAPFIYTLF